MKSDVSQRLAQLLVTNQASLKPSYAIEHSINIGVVPRGFHQWADEKPTHGGFLIKNSDDSTYWLAFVDWYENDEYYLILFDRNHRNPVAEIHEVHTIRGGKEFRWTYKPSKRDGENKRRQEYFAKCFYDINVRISLPASSSELPAFLDELFSVAKTRVKADNLDFSNPPEYRDGFVEGKLFERRHQLRDRNSKIVELAKRNFLQKNNRLFCQVCGFDFGKTYGKRGEGFIEAHHTVPLSELSLDGEETRVEDIALVCANCHRMLHRYRPWLSRADLKRLLSE
jgi:hypothetical protein